jgi:hypothetical protein
VCTCDGLAHGAAEVLGARVDLGAFDLSGERAAMSKCEEIAKTCGEGVILQDLEECVHLQTERERFRTTIISIDDSN